MISKIADFARLKLGCGYVYGATGWVCTQARRKQQAAQYPEYAGNILGVCARWDGKQCYDCAQLIRAAARAAGGTLPSGATSQWKSEAWEDKGTIDSLPEEAGIILYRQSGGKMQHTGVYVGDGKVVDSRSSAQGVMESALGSYSWTHWARLRLDDSVGSDENKRGEDKMFRKTAVTKIDGAKGSTVNLRDTPGGNVLAQVPFGTPVEIIREADGWSRFAFNGQEGWMQSKYLPAEQGGTAEMATVNRAELEAVYAAIGGMLGKVSEAYSAEARDLLKAGDGPGEVWG